MRNSSLKICGYLVIALVMGLSLAFSPLAEAMQIRITDSAGSITINDNGAGDANLTLGIIDYTGTDAYFNIKTCTGETKDSMGSASFPMIDLEGKATSIAVGATPLTLEITDINYGPMLAGLTGFVSSLSASKLEGTITLDTYYDNANNPFGTTNLIAHIGPFTGSGVGYWGDMISTDVSVDDNFSLTMVATLTPSGVDKTTQFVASLSPTPEPGTILLLGLGLLGLGIISRKKVKIED